MSAMSLFFHQSACNTFSVKQSNNKFPGKSKLCFRFRGSKGFLFGGFLLYMKKSEAKTMSDLLKTSAFRNDTDREERIQALEQESFIDGSSELMPNFVAGGIETTLNRLSKWLVSGLFGSVLLLRHDGAALWAVIGAVTNAMLSVALKRVLNQERPISTLRSDPGMPSSHAQSISFIAVFAVLSIMEWLGINEVSLFISGLILACASYFTWLRVSQKLHTVSQVVVGGITGSAFSILWYSIWNAIVSEAFVSSLWAQVVVFLGAAAFSLGFVVYVVLTWFGDDR